MNRRLALALLLVLAANAPRAWSENAAATDDLSAEARRAVESFCEADFHGLAARDSLATYSPAIRKAHEGEPGWPYVGFTWDPLTVVVAYRVGKVVANDSTASATVEYDEIARCVGRRRYVGLPRRATVVTFRLQKTGEVWKVLDPPEPRVSEDALIASYATELASHDEGWFRRASREQIDGYQSLIAALKFVKTLK